MNKPLSSVTIPWYRQRWPWLLMIAPLTAVIGGIITAWLAVRSNDGLVQDDYYKQGVAINRTLERQEKAHVLDLHGQMMFGESGRQVRLMLTGKTEHLPASLQLRIVHPTRSGNDQVLTLTRQTQSGFYEGKLVPLTAGVWEAIVEDNRNWRIAGKWRTGDAMVTLE